MTHFALRDLMGCVLALAAFLPLAFAPGYLFAWWGNLSGFRSASAAERVAWSVPISLAIGTLLMVWSASLGGMWLAVMCYLASAVGALALIAREWRRSPEVRSAFVLDRYTQLAILAVGIWIVALLLQLIDLQWGKSLIVSVTVRDQSYRVAFIEAVLRSGVPPTNPLYYAGHPALMRNYYFWYVDCAVVCKATMLSARDVLVASSAWASIGLFCCATLFCKYFLAPLRELRRTAFFSVLLFGVTGLDLIMVAYLHFSTKYHRFDGDMEWWDIDHFPSFLDNFLYVPHHVASLGCCLGSLVAFWAARDLQSRRGRWFVMVLGATAFTSAFGLSIYVAFAFAVTVTIWCIYLAFQRHFRLIRMIFAAAAIAVVLVLPFVLQLRSDTAAAGSKQSFPLAFRLRKLYGVDEWAQTLMRKSTFYAAHMKVVRPVLWLTVLTPALTVELGLYGLCGAFAFWQMRRGRLIHEEGTRSLVVLASAGMFATMAIRSSVIATINDYGFRTAMIPLFLMLVLSAKFVSEGLVSLKPAGASTLSFPFTKPLRITAFAFLLLGAAASLYQALGVRFFLTLYEQNRLRDHRTNGAFPNMGEHVYQLRDAYSRLDKLAPSSASVQYNPMTIGDYYFWINMLNAGHQIITAEPGCGKSFGGDENACPWIEAAVNSLYLDPAPNRVEAGRICRDLSIDFLVASDQDPAWHDSDSWVWSQDPVVEEPDIRILRCK